MLPLQEGGMVNFQNNFQNDVNKLLVVVYILSYSYGVLPALNGLFPFE